MTITLKILCRRCARKHREDILAIRRAKDGDRPPDESANILVCPPWDERRPEVPCEQRNCDECGDPIARAFSSDWLLEAAEHP